MSYVVVWWPRADQDVEVIGPFTRQRNAQLEANELERVAPETAAMVVELTGQRRVTMGWIERHSS